MGDSSLDVYHGFFMAGFPDPQNIEKFSFFRRLVDSFFESVSGYTTTGASILPKIEVFPRSILMWRQTSHFLGGMGIAYLAVTLIKKFHSKGGDIINCESESPDLIEFKNNQESRESGIDFLKIYSIITGILIFLLLISGVVFRTRQYTVWYDNFFDAVALSFATIATGGFSPYSGSVGIESQSFEGTIIGGIQNPVSEWIIAVFMLISSANFGIFYSWFFLKKWSVVRHNLEFKFYLFLVGLITFSIWTQLLFRQVYASPLTALRYAFFNVSSIISTTGFGKFDFTKWPA